LQRVCFRPLGTIHAAYFLLADFAEIGKEKIMVMSLGLNQPNVTQYLLGGGMANSAAGSMVDPMLSGLIASAPAPTPEIPQPNINWDALSKVNHPEIQKMVLQWLMNMAMQREQSRMQGGLEIGSVPFRYTQLPKEQWPEAAQIEAGIKPRAGSLAPGAGKTDLNELAKWQTIANNATEMVYDSRTGKDVRGVRPGQQNLINMAEKNIAAIEKRMADQAAREMGVSPSSVRSEPTNTAQEKLAHIRAVTSLVQKFPSLPVDLQNKVRAAMRAGATMNEILAAPEVAAYLQEQ
jgi:hypothetical protein